MIAYSKSIQFLFRFVIDGLFHLHQNFVFLKQKTNVQNIFASFFLLVVMAPCVHFVKELCNSDNWNFTEASVFSGVQSCFCKYI